MLVAIVGCNDAAGVDVSANSSAQASADAPTATPGASSATAGTGSLRASAAPGPLAAVAPRTIDPGLAPDGRAWLPKFSVRRDDGDQGASLLATHSACTERGMALCSETQWTRACAVDARVGTMESCTLTASGAAGFVVRGGERGCETRRVVAGSDIAQRRVGLCCDRAVGIVSSNETAGFRNVVSGKLAGYERGLNRRSTAALAPLLDERVTFFGKTYDHAMLLGRYQSFFTQEPNHWLAYDTCEVTIQNETEDATWTADCATTVHQRGEIARVVHRLVWTGEGKLRQVGETQVIRKFAAP